MKKERFMELGLGFCKEACADCEDSYVKDNELYCHLQENVSVKEAEERNMICPCLDEERIRMEMSDSEYDDYRHGRICIDETDDTGCYGAGSNACLEYCNKCSS